ncbi:MAG: hypothetical protein PHN25_02125 [Tissierellia bacterium]|nr:hypothetical protein [Tissierellia bacterium]
MGKTTLNTYRQIKNGKTAATRGFSAGKTKQKKAIKVLKNKLISNIEEFNKKNEWSKWSIINNIIKGKVGEKPGSWIENRKQMLGLAS